MANRVFVSIAVLSMRAWISLPSPVTAMIGAAAVTSMIAVGVAAAVIDAVAIGPSLSLIHI